MALSKQQDYWIHPNALSITLNYFGDPQLIQTSMLAGAVILAYEKNVITYDAAHNFREWQLQAYPTQLTDTCKYYVHAELSRTGHTAMIIYSPTKRDLEGRTFIDGAWDTTTSDTSWFIYLGEISASVDANGATVERVWTDGLHTGTLATDQHRMEEAQGEWSKMFQFNSVNEQIEPQHPFSTIKVAGEAIFQSVAKFIRGIVLSGKTLTAVAGTTDTQDQTKVNDATLPTTGYVQKEIEALDEHFLIKDDPDTEQSVAGPVAFEKDVTVEGDHTVGGNQTINGTQEVKGVQTLHQGFKTPDFFQQGDIIQGAQVDADGNAAFTSITAPVMQIYELQYNRKTAVQEEFIFSDGDTIETVTYIQADGTEIDSTAYDGEEYSYIRLGVRKQYEGYMTTFKDEDVLYSNVNIIGESGQPATTGKCWMRVLALDNDLGVEPISSDGLFINAILYSEAQCPGNVNMAPTPHMVISRHGNANGTLHPDRQSVFIISTKAENMVQLRGISSPIIPDTGAYAIVSGKLPSTLLAKVQKAAAFISENDPVSYARYGIFENFIQLDHDGLPIKTERYRGKWSIDEAVSNPYQSTDTSYDTVTHNGSLWQCQLTGTTVEPAGNTAEWLMMIAKGDSTLSTYAIKPSVNVVYFTKNGDDIKPSVDKIEVSVGETSSVGYSEITEQSELTEKGLSIWYNIDGIGEVKELNISPAAMFMLEDGSAIIATEDGSGLSLEGDELNLADIKDNITIYLKRGEDILSIAVIPVMKAGSFKSTVFSRDVSVKDTTPVGGSYYNPIPDGGKWSDGIPEGSGIIYSSSCTFYGDGTSSGWTKSNAMVDTADFEVLYSPVAFDGETNARNAIPVDFKKDGVDIDGTWLTDANNNGWYDENKDSNGNTFSALWMATNHRQSGSDWSDYGWVVTEVKGEKGDPGEDGADGKDGSNGKDGVDGKDGADGKDGKDGLTPQDNLLLNTNFDKYDEVGNLLHWDANGEVLKNPYGDGRNAYKGVGRDAFLKQASDVFVQGNIYTLSFNVKTESTYACVRLFGDFNNAFYVTSDTANVEFTDDGVKAVVPYDEVRKQVSLTIHALDTAGMFIEFGDELSQGTVIVDSIKLELGDTPTPYRKAEGDLTGPAGEAGTAMYPLGDWMANVVYKRTAESAPFVYYDADTSDNIEGSYYMLKAMRSVNEIPSERTDVWEAITGQRAIYAKFLMADFAMFGSKRGGVFYDRYLFSQYGLNREGLVSYFGDHREGSNAMFNKMGTEEDPTYVLNGNFQPNMFIDFFGGSIKTNRLSETFAEFERWYEDEEGNSVPIVCNQIDEEKSYNIKVTPLVEVSSYPSAGFGGSGSGNPLLSSIVVMPHVTEVSVNDAVLVPEPQWQPDGQRVCIVVRQSPLWNNVIRYIHEYNDYFKGSTSENRQRRDIALNCYVAGAILCADARCLDQRAYYGYSSDASDLIMHTHDSADTEYNPTTGRGFFSVNGCLTKFLFVEPGAVVTLRSCNMILVDDSNNREEYPIWYVENGDMFINPYGGFDTELLGATMDDVKVYFKGYYASDIDSGGTIKGASAMTDSNSYTAWLGGTYLQHPNVDFHRVFATKQINRVAKIASEYDTDFFQKNILIEARQNIPTADISKHILCAKQVSDSTIKGE